MHCEDLFLINFSSMHITLSINIRVTMSMRFMEEAKMPVCSVKFNCLSWFRYQSLPLAICTLLTVFFFFSVPPEENAGLIHANKIETSAAEVVCAISLNSTLYLFNLSFRHFLNYSLSLSLNFRSYPTCIPIPPLFTPVALFQ